MTSDLRDRKATLRSRLLAQRRSVPADVRAAEASALAAHVAALDVGPDETVCAFLPVGSEPGDASWLDGLRCRVLLPVVTGDSPLDWAVHTGPSDLVPAALRLLDVDRAVVGTRAEDVFQREDLKALGVLLRSSRGDMNPGAQEFALARDGRELHLAALHPKDSLVSPRLVRRSHRIGIAVHVWVVNRARRASELASLGVDGVMTDDPRIFLPV